MEITYEFNKVQNSRTNMEECIESCLKCYQSCLSCIPHCLTQGGKHSEADHITLMMECAELCRTSASIMQLKGEFAYELCKVCAQVCDACADSCSSIDPEDSMMQRCAQMCNRCAESCRSMSH